MPNERELPGKSGVVQTQDLTVFNVTKEAVLLVLAKSRILHALCARLGQMQRLIKFPIRQQPSVGGELASQELQLQCTVEIDPQVPVLAVTHWVPLSEWHEIAENPYILGVWRKSHAKRKRTTWEIGD